MSLFAYYDANGAVAHIATEDGLHPELSTLALTAPPTDRPPFVVIAGVLSGIGVAPNAGMIYDYPTKTWADPRTLAQVQDAQCNLIDAAYTAAIAQPVSFTTAGAVTKTFDADTQSAATLQSTLAGLSALQTVPSGFFWLSHDNTPVPFTYADLQGLAAAMLTQGWVAFQNRTVKKAAIRAATTIADVITITF